MNPDSTIPLIAGTALVSVLTVFIILFVILYKKAQLRFELERQQFEQALLESEVEIREQTLADIARELHDNIGQIASLAKIQLNMLPPATSEEEVEKIAESKLLLQHLISEIRGLSNSLNYENVQSMGLIGMMEKDINRINKSGFVKVMFHPKPTEISLDSKISIFLYRMFQEGINNILKHSGANQVLVGIEEKANQIVFHLEDNGVGIPKEKLQILLNNSTGNGLKNIKHRCKLIGATFNMESPPNMGTFIRINLPT
ncbi:sensor histidine kinase [Owenweeksia hongkongensis]|uniref:sensor histidine kinase n=1 Tax=Owenweeksia hongkongensis TaxID=253245 RepID=UPI003A9127F5